MLDLALISLLTLPVMAIIALAEAGILRRRGMVVNWQESASSLVIAAGQRVTGWVTLSVLGGVYAWCWMHRLGTIPLNSTGGIVCLFLASEFVYYWEHRIAHECRWFWASHAVHHSPERLNLSAAYRLGWTAGLTGAGLFPLPLVLMGFHPAAVAAMVAVNLLYQFWLHTELVPPLRFIDGVFNTPANHRVHHASNPRYRDRNYGGVLMVFDHLFGTYAAEDAAEPCRYGLVHPIGSHNPLTIVFHEWGAMIRDVRGASTWRSVGGYLLRAPDWLPDARMPSPRCGSRTPVARAGNWRGPAQH